MPDRDRLFAVTLLTVLETVLGILTLLGGMTLLIVGFFLPEIFPRVRYVAAGSTLSGLGLVGLAIVDFIVAFGLWSGVNWARTLALIFGVFGIGFSALSLFLKPRAGELVALLLDLIIVYYLMQPRVQRYFGTQATAL